jgi:hypothetical protein
MAWTERRGELGSGTHLFRNPPGEGWVTARHKTRAPGRFPSGWVATSPLELELVPRITDAEMVIDPHGHPFVRLRVNGQAGGIRRTHAIFLGG